MIIRNNKFHFAVFCKLSSLVKNTFPFICLCTPLYPHIHTQTHSIYLSITRTRTHTWVGWYSASGAHLVAVWIWWEVPLVFFSEVLPNMIMVSMSPVLLLESTLGAINQVPDDQPPPGERDRMRQRAGNTLKLKGKTDMVQDMCKYTVKPLTSSAITNNQVCIQV